MKAIQSPLALNELLGVVLCYFEMYIAAFQFKFTSLRRQSIIKFPIRIFYPKAATTLFNSPLISTAEC